MIRPSDQTLELLEAGWRFQCPLNFIAKFTKYNEFHMRTSKGLNLKDLGLDDLESNNLDLNDLKSNGLEWEKFRVATRTSSPGLRLRLSRLSFHLQRPLCLLEYSVNTIRWIRRVTRPESSVFLLVHLALSSWRLFSEDPWTLLATERLSESQ